MKEYDEESPEWVDVIKKYARTAVEKAVAQTLNSGGPITYQCGKEIRKHWKDGRIEVIGNIK